MAPPVPALPASLPPGTVIGEYRVVEKLGEGAMGAVYGAVHPVVARRAAVKVIHLSLCADGDAVERFVQEARTVNQIHHPTIVEVFSFGKLADGRHFSVMEWLQGETLGAHLHRVGRIPLDEAVAILEPICRGLEAVHRQGIIHRDLKPENVFLVGDEAHRHVKLLDFGLAKLAGSEDQRLERTRSGRMMGTPLYVSPEQSRGRPVDYRTDLYALGAMAFHMVAGRPPFDADNAMDVIAQHLNTPPPPLRTIWPDAPPALEALLLALMDKEPDRRPSLDEVRDRLTRVREAAPAPRSRRWIAIAAGTVVVAIAVALVYLPLQRPASPPAPVAVVAPAPAPPVAPAPLRSSVVITADAPNARIVIDGQVIAESAASARTEVEARADGHEVVVSAPGRRPFRTRLKIDPGASAEVSARLELLKAAEHKPARRQRIPEPAVDDDAPLRVFDK